MPSKRSFESMTTANSVLRSKKPWTLLISSFYQKKKIFKNFNATLLRKIVSSYIHFSKVLDTALGTVLIPESWVFLFLRTEHTFFF